MSDATQSSGDGSPLSSQSDAGDLAAEALRQAQRAVSDLRENTTPVMAATGGDEDAAAALRAAQQAIAAAKAENGGVGGAFGSGDAGGDGGFASGAKAASTPGNEAGQGFNLPSFGAPGVQKVPEGIDLLSDVNLNVKIELGRTRMLVEDVLRLGEGSVVELDKLAGDPVEVYVNDRHVARGEVLVLNDNFCVRINEIVAGVGDHPAIGKRR